MALNTPQEQRIRRRGTVPAALSGMRFDRVAATLFDEFSRAMLSQWIQSGALTVDGRSARPKDPMLGGEILELDAELEAREDWASADRVPFEVVHEDDEVLVVNKPPGLVVHPGAGNPRGTLVNGLLEAYPELRVLARAGIVHRLDKDTSGLLLVARTPQAQYALSGMLSRREVSRRYLAVVEGCLTGGMDIEAPLGRDPVRRTRQAVRADGRSALTRVRVLERYRAHTLVEAVLETGRTHQIRVHLAWAGHPLVGDSRYGARRRVPPRAADATVAAVRAFSRQALHAWRLAFVHPGSGRRVRLEAEPPADFQALVAALQTDAWENDSLPEEGPREPG